VNRIPTLEDLNAVAALEVLIEHIEQERPIASRDFALRTLRNAARLLRGTPRPGIAGPGVH